ncbi:oxidoreductase [Jimgerdemannia flammicorona]|uniref:Oxidoreductase n=1 Tax=Jimgerdemannia flammicorona TaxID=994334 RepID=A0A433QA82_9FUNG|nr:oxidoreductase [Jimgerdemannia flammicorona]
MGIFGRLQVPPHDLTGKIVIVTGANVGIGLETARYFAANHAQVVIACRNPSKAKVALEDLRATTGSDKIESWELDLSSFASVRAFSDRFLQNCWPLDILVNNAGLAGSAQLKRTPDGFEELYQVNHLSHFLLTNLLLPALKRSSAARVINVSSVAHKSATLDFDNLNGEKFASSHFVLYNNSKLCNVLFTKELARRVKEDGIVVHAVHPGSHDFAKPSYSEYVIFSFVASEFGKDLGPMLRMFSQVVAFIFARDPVEGAQTTIHAAISKEAGESTGDYWDSCRVDTVAKVALDEDMQRRLWEVSVKAVGL